MTGTLDNGQMSVKLDLILDSINELKRSMVTKEVFEVWKNGNSERLGRVEADLAKWVQESTAAHVKLDSESEARHTDVDAKITAMEIRIGNRIDTEKAKRDVRLDKIVEDQKANEKDLKGVRQGRVTLWIGGAIAFISNFAFWYLTTGGPR
jgi:hypothetical protein